jgi:hypothetical protein
MFRLPRPLPPRVHAPHLRHPWAIRSGATDTLNRQLRSGINDAQLAELVIALRDDDRLSIVDNEEQARDPQIICSLGLYEPRG